MSQPRTFTARSPVDLVAAVPQVLGFHPEDSVVLLTFGPGEAFHARVDLPADEEKQLAVVDLLREVVTRHAVRRVALLLYSDDPWVAATFHDAAVPVLVRDGVDVIDALRVGPDRFHRACDVDDPGTAYDLTTHAFTAERVLDGAVVERSRADLAATLDTVDADDAAMVEDATHRLDDEFVAVAQFVKPGRIVRDMADHARWVQRMVRRHAQSGAPLSADDAGRLLLLVSIVEIRDVALAEISRPDAHRHVELWRDLVRRSPRDLVPAAAALLAFAAWLSGHGALAWCAVDRCVAVDPAYSLAECVSLLLERAVPPSVWTPIADDDLAVFWPPDRRAS